jgi:uncharacterized protein YgbK (DUF1537 family)
MSKKTKVGRPRMGRSLRVVVSGSVDPKTAKVLDQVRKKLPPDRQRIGFAMDAIAEHYNKNS